MALIVSFVKLQYEKTCRKFECDFIGCRKSFSNKKKLKRHTDGRHLKLKAFKCPMCEAGFVFKNALDTHLKVIHQKLKPFHCYDENCDAAFSNRKHRYGNSGNVVSLGTQN